MIEVIKNWIVDNHRVIISIISFIIIAEIMNWQYKQALKNKENDQKQKEADDMLRNLKLFKKFYV